MEEQDITGVHLNRLVFHAVRDRVDSLGVFVVAEIGWAKQTTGKYALGGWSSTNEAPARDGIGTRSGDRGVYVLLEQISGPVRSFARLAVADAQVNPIDAFVGAGLVYVGLATSEDELGFAVAAARAGEGPDQGRWEVALELTYWVEVYDGLRVQPVLQYVHQPSFSGVADSVAGGLRILVEL